VAHEFIEFLEATLIAEQVNSFARRQLSSLVLALAASAPPPAFGFSIQAMQLVGFVLVGHSLMKTQSPVHLQSHWTDVLRLRPDQVILGVLLDHVRAPTRRTAAREHGNELLWLEPKRL